MVVPPVGSLIRGLSLSHVHVIYSDFRRRLVLLKLLGRKRDNASAGGEIYVHVARILERERESCLSRKCTGHTYKQ